MSIPVFDCYSVLSLYETGEIMISDRPDISPGNNQTLLSLFLDLEPSNSMQESQSIVESPLTSLCRESGSQGNGSVSSLPSVFGPMIGCTAESGGQSNSAVVSSTSCSTSSLALNRLYPSSHPLSMAKHICAICGDRASGKKSFGPLLCSCIKSRFLFREALRCLQVNAN